MNRGEIYLYLRGQDPRTRERLLAEVDALRTEAGPERIAGLGQIILSSNCVRDCIFCWFSSALTDFHHFRLGMGEIMAGAAKARAAGVRTLILRVADDPGYSPEALSEVVRGLVGRFEFDLVLALGERKAPLYAQWRNAGARGYWLQQETCDPFLYRHLRPSMFGVDRSRSQEGVQASGLALASGLMVGMPNQSFEGLVDSIVSLAEQEVFAATVEPFAPPPASKGAAYLRRPEHLIVPADATLLEKVITVLRLLRPRMIIPVTNAIAAGLGGLADDRFFRAGSNAVILDFTPVDLTAYRPPLLFSGLPASDEGAVDAVRAQLQQLGLTLDLGRAVLPGS
jgi:biotin synthase